MAKSMNMGKTSDMLAATFHSNDDYMNNDDDIEDWSNLHSVMPFPCIQFHNKGLQKRTIMMMTSKIGQIFIL